MKRSNKIYLSVFILAVFFGGCQKNVSLTPNSFSPTTVTTEAQLTSQLSGVYNILAADQATGLGLYSHALWGYLVAGADETFRTDAVTGSTTQVLTETYRAANNDATYYNFWKALYIGIERANVVISVINQPVMDSTKRANILGQALFLRGYYFYLLAANFGDVPLKIKLTTDMGTNFNLARAPLKDVYAQVLSDMKRADSLVPTIQQNNTTTIVSKTAVEAILARVCLTMAGYPLQDVSKYKDAYNWSQKVINSNLHNLNNTTVPGLLLPGTTVLNPATPAYSRVFINNMQNNYTNNNTTEGIWDAAFLSQSNSSGAYANTGYPVTQQLGSVMGITNTNITSAALIGYSAGTYRVFPKLYNLFKPGDLRRDWAIAPYIYKDSTATKYPILTVNITGGGGTGATAVATVSNTNKITAITVENQGSGYTSAPSITFTSTAGSGATATATVSGGKVTDIQVSNQGSAYPTIYDHPAAKWRREYQVNAPTVRLNGNTSCNFPIVRFADVLLMNAEADLMMNGGAPGVVGVEAFNRVRRRAFGYSYASPQPGFDVTTFTLQDIMDERSRELCFEGQRRNDLIRWGVMQKVMQQLVNDNATNAPTTYSVSASYAASNFLSNPSKFLLFPIPQNEVNNDYLLTQNPAW